MRCVFGAECAGRGKIGLQQAPVLDRSMPGGVIDVARVIHVFAKQSLQNVVRVAVFRKVFRQRRIDRYQLWAIEDQESGHNQHKRAC